MTKTFRNPTVEEVEKGEKLLSCIKGSKKMAKATSGTTLSIVNPFSRIPDIYTPRTLMMQKTTIIMTSIELRVLLTPNVLTKEIAKKVYGCYNLCKALDYHILIEIFFYNIINIVIL